MQFKRHQPSQTGGAQREPKKHHNFYSDLKNKWAPNAKVDDLSPKAGTYCILLFLLSVVFLLAAKNYQMMLEDRPAVYDPQVTEIEILESYPKEMINYAADFNGARINYRLTSESLFSNEVMHLKYVYNNSPDLILKADNTPGQCWALKEQTGKVTISLSHSVYPQHFTLVHAKLSDHNTAPRDVCLYNKQKLLVCHIFSLDERVPQFSQVFACQSNCDSPLDEVTLEIKSNHGAPNTCVYQLMVHGNLAQ